MKKLNYFFTLLFVFCFCRDKSFGQCAKATSKVDLDISNVRATILNEGHMWYSCSGGTAQCEVPKSSGKHSLIAGALWIGGFDQGGNLRLDAQTYCQSGTDFWPGPIDTTACTYIDSVACRKFDYLWKINRQDVIDFIGGSAATPDMISYPGNGEPIYNQDHFLAPFYDKNLDGIYNTNDGDYPLFDFLGTTTGCGDCNTLHGDQAIWWVMNDVGNTHNIPGSSAIGLEIQCQAFAYSTSDTDINNTIFYHYKIINRNCTNQINQTYFGMWIDPDLGYYNDDYVASDVGRGMGYCYNGDGNDETGLGYGLKPPAVGVDILQGPRADIGDGIDNDRDSCIDCTYVRNAAGVIIDTIPDTVMPEYIKMSKFIYYNNDASVMGNPSNAIDYYNYLRGIWRDGVQMTYGGNGHSMGPGWTTDTCDFMFPNFSDPYNWGTDGKSEAQWNEVTAGNPPGDRRFVMSTGPFTMKPGAIYCIKVGVPWARDFVGTDNSVAKLKLVDDKIQRLADSCFDIASFTGIKPVIKPSASVYPNPVTDALVIRMNQFYKDASVSIYDVTGKMILTQHYSGNEFSISCKSFSSGVYFYRINLKGEESVSGKFLKE